MTNTDIIEELNTIHFSLSKLRDLCDRQGVYSVDLDSYVELIENRYSVVHEALDKMLSNSNL
jgi:hypothetical protein